VKERKGFGPIGKAIITIGAGIYIAVGPAGNFAEADDSAITCLHRSSDTDYVLPRVQTGLSGIPRSIQSAMFSAGYKIVVTPTMNYGKSSDRERRSDYDVHDENAAGMFVPGEKTVYIPERASWRNEPPQLQDDDVVNVMRHEFGHAYDSFMNHVSGTATFADAYQQDASRLSNSQRSDLSYFAMQDAGTNSTELFAQLFSIICSPNDKYLRPTDRELYEAFPHYVQALLALNSELRPHTFSRSAASSASGQTANTSSKQLKARSIVQPAVNARAQSLLQTASGLIGQRKFKDAIPYLDQAVSADPSNAYAFSYRGYANLSLGNYRAAAADYEKVLQLNPGDASAAQNLQLARTNAH
jgi:tetratricopeptide (TPR) repeat protein